MKRTLENIIEDELPKVNLNKKQLAELVGLSTGHFTNISNGKASSRKNGYQPEPEVVNKLAYYLRVSVEEILEGLGYNLTKIPPDLVGFVTEYKKLSETEQDKLSVILSTIIELIVKKGQDKETEKQLGTATINGQEVAVRIIEPTEELALINKD